MKLLDTLKHWEDHLVEDWDKLVLHLWSMRLALATVYFQVLDQIDVISLVQTAVPYLDNILPERVFSYVSILTAILIPIARLIKQQAPADSKK